MALQRWAILAIGLVSALTNRPVRGDEPTPAPISVLAQVPAKPYYVGQAIELRVGALAAGERPEVVAPEIPSTEIALIGTDLSPVSATGIGNLTGERNLFVTKYRLIARRAGLLRIPPVRVRLGARSGASRPLEIDVQSLPLVGRPAAFLGGVGVFAVAAEVSPNTVRAGQELTYTIHVTGPAARGMTGSPSLTRFSELSLGLQVEPLAAVVVNSPPSCQFRYRIRPTRAGTASLPPVAVAAFDPQTAHYVTRVTSSIPIHVVDVPRFDTSTLDYPPPPAPEKRRVFTASGVRVAAWLCLGLVATVVAGLVAWHVRNRWRADSRRAGSAAGPGGSTRVRLPSERRARSPRFWPSTSSGQPVGPRGSSRPMKRVPVSPKRHRTPDSVHVVPGSSTTAIGLVTRTANMKPAARSWSRWHDACSEKLSRRESGEDQRRGLGREARKPERGRHDRRQRSRKAVEHCLSMLSRLEVKDPWCVRRTGRRCDQARQGTTSSLLPPANRVLAVL